MEEECKVIEIPNVETVPLVVRNINGEGVLFTLDGKMIGHQVASMGHYYYQGRGTERVKMYRASFVVDKMPSDVPR